MGLADIAPNTVGGYIGALFATAFVYFGVHAVYNLFFHPLAKFPGPKLAAISNLWYAYYWTNGRWALALAKAHEKYGDVVRTSPNELSFATAESYRDIYGHASKGRRPFLKSDFYSANGRPISIVSARDPLEHRTQRQSLSAAFSSKALRDQEEVVHKYVDMFIDQIGKLGAPDTKGINTTEAFNWLTFDIIGDLTFGESFDAVKNGKTHPWVSMIVESSYWGNLVGLRKRIPLLNLVLPFLVHKDLSKELETHWQLTVEKTKRRVDKKDTITKEDFFKQILKKNDWDMGKLESNAELLIIAGSETTATTLSGVMYFLFKNPHCMAKLEEEVLGSFKSYDEITGDSTAKLPYLHAVFEEGLRCYPPVAFGLPRVSPGSVVSGHYVPAGTIVGTHMWSVKHSPKYWHDPNSYRPERWIGEGFGDDKSAFNPFSLGPRVCLGINLAYLELRIILAKMVWKYHFETVDKDVDWIRENLMYVLWKKPDVHMRFHPREHVNA
ncbi:cytochrome P450 [Corynespora cassiicola Philippines]|uniref:Cytochrome P450 n=1 Tax=Corynespora cassiicola Philippines TaxID=1448308 RepID=A0A2T2NWW3_CORCC|nr:cytochrome P450 [Corynespora cassiicola Philippines]